MHAHPCPPRTQQGSVLLEALIGILIFSMGILAIVGLQATSIKLASDAKYRSDASLLANQLIGKMWGSDRTAATLKSAYESGSTYNAWASQVQATLPGVSGSNLPVVSVSTAASSVGQVTVTVYWQSPAESNRHTYNLIAQIQ